MSDTSFAGIAGFYTDNKSYGLGALVSTAFQNNRYKFSAFLGSVDLEYDVSQETFVLTVDQTADIGAFSFGYGLDPDTTIGLSARYLDTELAIIDPGGASVPVFADRRELFTTGVFYQSDTRDDTLFARSGHNFRATLSYSTELDDRISDYPKAIVTFDRFHKASEKTVLSGRATACVTTSDAPYFDRCSLGGTDGFRGYESTEFLGESLISLQGEARNQFYGRFAASVFAGAALVDKTFQPENENGIKAAIGVGLRYLVLKKFPLDLSVDVSFNDASDANLYLYVGQRF